MKPRANDIGQHLVKIRSRRKLTQEQLAAKLQIGGANMTRQIIANLEARRQTATDQQIVALVKVLHCSLDELFFGIDRPPAPHSGQFRLTSNKPRQ